MTDITLEQRAEVEQVLRALEFGNRNRCPVCAGFDPKGNGETDRRHTKTCPVPRAIAALRLSAGAEWQPIETAPKDGSVVLLHSIRRGTTVAGYWNSDWEEWSVTAITHFSFVSHWLPLPAAPRHETGEE